MSYQEHQDDCPLCRPAVIDVNTNRVLSDDAPIMKAILGVWAGTTLEERQAFHRFTCLNSRETVDMNLMAGLQQRMAIAMRQVPR